MLAHVAPEAPWREHLLAFDLETTGVDRFADVPVSYAFVEVRAGVAVKRDGSLVDPGREIPPGATAVHGITSERARREGVPLGIAVRRIAETLLEASSDGVPVVGMKLDYDLTMVDSCYRRETGRGLADNGFRGPVLDALVLDRHLDRYRRGRRTLVDLCAHYGVFIEQAHDASADAKAAAEVVLALCDRYPELRRVSPGELFVSQQGWHRAWVESFAQWRSHKGLHPMDDEDAAWPIASAPRALGAQAG